MPDPCFPAIHTPATLQSWAVWRAAHPWWRQLAIAAGCAAAAAVPVAVFYPYAEATPAIAAPLPPLPSPGSAGQGFYVPPYLPPHEGSEFSPYVPAGETSTVLTGFSPMPGETITAPLVPPSVPPTTVGSVPPPPTAVPEPASLALLAVGAGGAVLVRRTQKKGG